MVYVFLAEGFEEIEAVATIDILRRAGIDVVTVGIGSNVITGAHGITVSTTIEDASLNGDEFDMAVLPGGTPGIYNLAKSRTVKKILRRAIKEDKYIAAICAAPSILGQNGWLKGKKAVCYPGFESALEGAEIVDQPVVTDGKIITSKGAGTAMEFGFTLVSILCGGETANKIRAGMQCQN
ncbi:MAG: DJ-1/PfpI family protein [Oscillospiraceae bacterium]|jgi:4-methyl-5(b-hydroxyethyl)-thiazole monophosphate biosynthesis|nr:DJ-1/PfpI family protein [Oscillospiraceae bacterium]